RFSRTAGALLLRGRRRLSNSQKHSRSTGVLRARRDQRSAIFQARLGQLPQSADLYGAGAAAKADPAVSLRVEPARTALARILRNRGRLRGAVRTRRTQGQAVSVPGRGPRDQTSVVRRVLAAHERGVRGFESRAPVSESEWAHAARADRARAAGARSG